MAQSTYMSSDSIEKCPTCDGSGHVSERLVKASEFDRARKDLIQMGKTRKELEERLKRRKLNAFRNFALGSGAVLLIVLFVGGLAYLFWSASSEQAREREQAVEAARLRTAVMKADQAEAERLRLEAVERQAACLNKPAAERCLCLEVEGAETATSCWRMEVTGKHKEE